MNSMGSEEIRLAMAESGVFTDVGLSVNSSDVGQI